MFLKILDRKSANNRQALIGAARPEDPNLLLAIPFPAG
jgi:hypothetical protein